MFDFGAYLNIEVPNGKFAAYNSVVSSSPCKVRYPVLDPDHRFLDRTSERAFDPYLAIKNAKLYRSAILDESLPAELDNGSHMLLDQCPWFCRSFWIIDLGRIRYAPACPELREVMLHDLQPRLRRKAAEALGKIGDNRYTRDLVYAMQNDKQISRTAMFALGYMADDSAFHALREMFEDTRYKFECTVRAAHLKESGVGGAGDFFWEQCEELRDVTDVMVRIGGEALKFIRQWSRYEFYEWLIRSMNTGIEISKIGRSLRKGEA